MKLTGGNRSTRGKTCPQRRFVHKNPTWTDPRSNSGLRDERPATNRLSHGTLLFNQQAVVHLQICVSVL
jgi:hypothetical protein